MSRQAYGHISHLAEALQNTRLLQLNFLIKDNVSGSNDAAADLRLSEAHVLAIQAVLMMMGVDSARIAIAGRVGLMPLSPVNNASENQRISFRKLH